MRRRTIAEGFQEETETALGLFLAHADRFEHLLLQLLIMDTDRTAPVSYTHLDGYKRQIVFGAVKDRPVAFDPVLAIGVAILHEITEGDRPLFQLFDEMDERTVDLFHLVIVQDVDRTDIHQRIRQHLHAFAMDDVRFLSLIHILKVIVKGSISMYEQQGR